MLGRELVDQSHPMAKTPVRWWPPLADSKAPGRDPAWGAAQELYELVFPGAGLRRGPVPTVRQLLEVMHFNVMTSCWEHRSALLFKVSESPYVAALPGSLVIGCITLEQVIDFGVRPWPRRQCAGPP
jgi:hypothetical protein